MLQAAERNRLSRWRIASSVACLAMAAVAVVVAAALLSDRAWVGAGVTVLFGWIAAESGLRLLRLPPKPTKTLGIILFASLLVIGSTTTGDVLSGAPSTVREWTQFLVVGALIAGVLVILLALFGPHAHRVAFLLTGGALLAGVCGLLCLARFWPDRRSR